MFNFKSFIDFRIDFFFVAITIFFIILPIVVYKQYRKRYDKEKIYWPPDNFWEYIFGNKISMGLSFTAGIVFFIMAICFTTCDFIAAISNRYEEPAIYEKYVERGKMITNYIEVSDDITNTVLYNNAIDYNTDLAEIKAKYADSRFEMNFTGNYDWNAIPYIDLKGE